MESAEKILIPSQEAPTVKEGLDKQLLLALEARRNLVRAKKEAKDIETGKEKGEEFFRVAEEEIKLGLDPSLSIQTADENFTYGQGTDQSDQDYYLKRIGILYAEAGLFDMAKDDCERINDTQYSIETLSSIAIEQNKRGIDPRPTLEYAWEKLETGHSYARAVTVMHIVEAEIKIGNDPIQAIERANFKYDELSDEMLQEIAGIYASAGLFDEAYEVAKKSNLPWSFISIAKQEVALGKNSEQALKLAYAKIRESLEENYSDFLYINIRNGDVNSVKRNSVRGYLEIAKLEKDAGKDTSKAFAMAIGTIEGLREEDEYFQALLYSSVATAQIQVGQEKEGLDTFARIPDNYKRLLSFDPYLALAKELIKKGEDASSVFKTLRTNLSGVKDSLDFAGHCADLAKVEIEGGYDAIPTLELLENSLNDIHASSAEAQLRNHCIAEIKFQMGHKEQAYNIIEHMTSSEVKVNAYINLEMIAREKAKQAIDAKYTQEDLLALLQKGRDDVAHAIGFFYPDIVDSLPEDIPPHIRNSVMLGRVESQQKNEDIPSVGAEIEAESSDVEKRAFSRSMQQLDYEIVSNQLLQKVKAETDVVSQLRYLKTLIEIENPKGRTIATKLYTNRDLPDSCREYLLRKLIDEGHWDPALGEVLQERIYKYGIPKSKADEVITAIIDKLNLIPEKAVYEALESPGILKGATLEERLEEIFTYKQTFEQYDREHLLDLFKRDEKSLKIYYLINGGQFSYTLINDYTFEKFKIIIDKINNLNISHDRVNDFRDSLITAGVEGQTAELIVADMLSGKFPLMGNERSFSFNTRVETGSDYAQVLGRLQSVWSEELRKVLIAGVLGDKLSNASEVEGYVPDEKKLEGMKSKTAQRMQRFIKEFGIGEKQSEKTLKGHAERMKKELMQRYRQAKDKISTERLSTAPDSQIISEYFETYLPELKDQGFWNTEWKSHLSETLTTLETSQKDKKQPSKDVDIEVTFVDKGKDFVRSVRFADGQRCCFNSTNYIISDNAGSADWVARLNKDPLSFILDIKEKDAKEISGFVFGRMGIDPENGKPVVMLNGIYSQFSGKVFADNLLSLIENKFAKVINADSILLASKHGGMLSGAPTGYEQAHRQVNAIRAIDEDSVYDDIGTVANGPFGFEGFVKELV